MPSRYYTSLLPFRELFATGTPVLTYHHVGPRPHRARLKGLYVSPKLFSRQLDELKAHKFITPQYQDVLSHPARARSVFFTFDDGFTDVFTNAMPLLNGRGYRAIEFLVAGLIGKTNEWQQRAGDVIEPLMDSGRLGEWLAAGHEIGAHTMTHPRLTQVPPAQAREEISASKKKLEDLFGIRIEHFCYPYGDWNQAVRDMVQDAGFVSACTTEFAVNQPSTDPFCLKRITARYRSRSLKNAAAWVREKLS